MKVSKILRILYNNLNMARAKKILARFLGSIYSLSINLIKTTQYETFNNCSTSRIVLPVWFFLNKEITYCTLKCLKRVIYIFTGLLLLRNSITSWQFLQGNCWQWHPINYWSSSVRFTFAFSLKINFVCRHQNLETFALISSKYNI